jgi:hypothetical protein
LKKIFIPLFMVLTLFVTACGQAVSTQAVSKQEVIEPTQAPPTQTPEVMVEPTQAATNTPEPTAIPPTPTEESTVFFSSGVTVEDLADKLPLFDVLLSEKLQLLAEGIALGSGGTIFSENEFFTIFAAKELPEGLTGMAEVVKAISYLIVPGLYLEADLLEMDGKSIPTMMKGTVINITVKDGEVYLNDVAMVIQTDILAQNGVIHVIDTFLLAPTNTGGRNSDSMSKYYDGKISAAQGASVRIPSKKSPQ